MGPVRNLGSVRRQSAAPEVEASQTVEYSLFQPSKNRKPQMTEAMMQKTAITV